MNISREERKNLAVIKLIERQEKQKNKREEKKKLQVSASFAPIHLQFAYLFQFIKLFG